MEFRDVSRRTLALRGLISLLALAVVVGVLALVGRGQLSDRIEAVVQVDDAGGALVTGADVKVHGVVVGRVTSLAASTAGGAPVEIGVQLDPGLAPDVPGDVRARILPATIFGTAFVDLVPSGSAPGGEAIRAGQVIEQDTSAETLEVQALLDGMDRVIDSLGPAELATALDGMATALDGNGERLGRTMETLAAYLERLNPQMPLVRRNLELLATNLEAFTDYAPGLLDAVDDVLVAARTVATHEDEFAELVRSGGSTFGRTHRVLSANEQALVDMLVRTAVVIDVLYDERRTLAEGLVSTVTLADRFSEALSEGRYLKIEGNLQLVEDAPYGPERCPQFGSARGRGC